MKAKNTNQTEVIRELREELKLERAMSEITHQSLDETESLMKRAVVASENILKSRDDVQTVLNLAIERARQRANRALIEYDEAMTELSRLTAKPEFSLQTHRVPVEKV